MEVASAGERPGTMSNLSVSTKQERLPQQQAGSSARWSTSNPPLAESLLRLQRSAGNRATVALQRRFLSKTGDAPEVAVQPAAALDVLAEGGKRRRPGSPGPSEGPPDNDGETGGGHRHRLQGR